MAQPTLIQPKPGIKRDGTRFDTDTYVDGEWVRFNERGRPRKIAGYQLLTPRFNAISRGLHGVESNQSLYVFSGGTDRLEVATIESGAVTGLPVVRTPTTFVSHADVVWQMVTMWDAVSGALTTFAHGPRNRVLSSNVEATIFSGSTTASTVLAPVMDGASEFQMSGGMVGLHPYMMYFGDAGEVVWSVADRPSDVTGAGSGSARVTSAKIVAGRRTRSSGGQSPSGILWSLDKIVRVAFVGGTAVFAFDEIASHSLLSNASIVEVGGQFFWPGVDGFYMYNGVVRDMPPPPLSDDFFSNINWSYSGRTFGHHVPRWGEIWWCYPRGTSTECNHALIYNYRLNAWYDTPLPNSGRSASLSPFSLFRWPMMTGVDEYGVNQYRLWKHETGTDEIDENTTNAIRSYFETSDMSLMRAQQPSNAALAIRYIEPDFLQTGDLTLTVKGNANARAPTLESESFTITETAADSSQQILRLSEERRQVRIRVESNTLGGHYELGALYAHTDVGSETLTT